MEMEFIGVAAMIRKNEMKWMAGVLAVGIIFIYLTMLYSDNLVNSSVGYNMADSFFMGRFSEYYNSMSWSYGLSIYFIYAIWSIPVWIIGRIGNMAVNMEAIPVLLWYKLLLVIFAVWSVWLVGKIAEELYRDNAREVMLQYMASFFLIYPVLAIAQCDIIGLCFVLLGLYYYIKERNFAFIVSFAIAITMKYFALFAFLPLLLFRFRKIGKLITTLALGVIFAVASALIILGSDAGGTAMADSDYYVNEHIWRLAEVKIDIGSYKPIGLLGLFFAILCILAFILPNEDTEKNKKYAVWLAFSGYLCFFLFYGCNFYWYVLLAPFLILLAYTKPGYTKICLLLEMLFGVTVAFDCMNKQSWVFLGQKTFNYLFIRKDIVNNWLFGRLRGAISIFRPLIIGVSYAAAIGILVLTFPGLKDAQVEDGIEKEIRIITWARIGVIFMWIGLALIGTMQF